MLKIKGLTGLDYMLDKFNRDIMWQKQEKWGGGMGMREGRKKLSTDRGHIFLREHMAKRPRICPAIFINIWQKT